eukprot:403369637
MIDDLVDHSNKIKNVQTQNDTSKQLENISQIGNYKQTTLNQQDGQIQKSQVALKYIEQKAVDMQSFEQQQQQLNQIFSTYQQNTLYQDPAPLGFNHLKSPPISRDNQIKFINHGSFLRCPSERKTPPPPKWGEDENEGYNPYEAFYDRRKDPHHYSQSNRRLITKREFKNHTKIMSEQTDRPKPLNPPIQLTEETKQQIARKKDFLMNGQLNLNKLPPSLIQNNQKQLPNNDNIQKQNGNVNAQKPPLVFKTQPTIPKIESRPIRSGAFQRLQQGLNFRQ